MKGRTRWRARPTVALQPADWSLCLGYQFIDSCHFGAAVAVSGRTIVVGAPFTKVFRGFTYIYVKAPSGWPGHRTITLHIRLSAVGYFGMSVGVSGVTAVVGAFSRNGGVAYIYRA
jgi:hypothetical protein